MRVKVFLCVVLLTGASLANAADIPDELEDFLWFSRPNLSFDEIETILDELTEITGDDANAEPFLETREAREFLVDAKIVSLDALWSKCEAILMPDPMSSVDDHYREWRIWWCEREATELIDSAIEQLQEFGETAFTELMSSIGVVSKSSKVRSDMIARGIKNYLVARIPDLERTRSANHSGEVDSDFVGAYSNEITSLCSLLSWSFRQVTPGAVRWMRKSDSRRELIRSRNLWLKRRDVCQTILDHRDDFIRRSFRALADETQISSN